VNKTVLAGRNILSRLFGVTNPFSISFVVRKAFWEVHNLLCIKKETKLFGFYNTLKIFLQGVVFVL